MRAHVMTFETLLNDEENQVRGFTYVFDEKDVSWSHISIWTPSEVSKAFACCERALPMRHKDIHFLHLPWTMNLIFQFAKSLLSEKIRQRFKTHSNLDHLQKSVETSILPSEYGGKISTKECIQKWKKELEENRRSLLDLDLLKVDHGSSGEHREHSGVVRKKSRHDSDSGSQVSTTIVQYLHSSQVSCCGLHLVHCS